MNPYLTCSNTFSQATIDQISGYRNRWDCLACDLGETCQLDLGYGGPGTAALSVCGGDLSSGTTADLELTGGFPLGAALIQVGLSVNPTPFKGGLLVPVPGNTVGPLILDAAGSLVIPGIQGGGGSYFHVYYAQVMYEDPGLPAPSVGLSNAVRIHILP